MAMQLVKKTADYSIYKRGDDRYAVKGANKKPVNGEDKVRILLEEGLVKAPAVKAPVEEVAEAEAPAEDSPAEEASADDSAADDSAAEKASE